MVGPRLFHPRRRTCPPQTSSFRLISAILTAKTSLRTRTGKVLMPPLTLQRLPTAAGAIPCRRSLARLPNEHSHRNLLQLLRPSRSVVGQPSPTLAHHTIAARQIMVRLHSTLEPAPASLNQMLVILTLRRACQDLPSNPRLTILQRTPRRAPTPRSLTTNLPRRSHRPVIPSRACRLNRLSRPHVRPSPHHSIKHHQPLLLKPSPKRPR